MKKDISKQEEKTLVYAAINDIAAFSDLYKHYVDKIYNYFYYRVYNNSDIASDLTSELFLKVLEALQNKKYKYDENIGFAGWLFRVAHNLVVDYYKKSKTHQQKSLDEALVGVDSISTGIEKQIDNQQIMIKLNALLAKFDDQTQELVVLKCSEDYTFNQIAQIMQLNESTVKMKFYRAVESLKKSLPNINL